MNSAIPPSAHSAAAPRLPEPTIAPNRRSANARIFTVVFFVGFVLLQLITPVAQLLWAPRPARFGWQMFSIVAPPPVFTLVRDDGTSSAVDIKPYVISLRGDVPLAQFLPPHLCRVVPHVVAVRIQPSNVDQVEVYRCSR
jgi:hypothetical protein